MAQLPFAPNANVSPVLGVFIHQLEGFPRHLDSGVPGRHVDVVREIDVAVLATDLERLLVGAADNPVHAPFEHLRDAERGRAPWR